MGGLRIGAELVLTIHVKVPSKSEVQITIFRLFWESIWLLKHFSPLPRGIVKCSHQSTKFTVLNGFVQLACWFSVNRSMTFSSMQWREREADCAVLKFLLKYPTPSFPFGCTNALWIVTFLTMLIDDSRLQWIVAACLYRRSTSV